MPKELQNLAGEPYSESDSMKTSVDNDNKISKPEDLNNNFTDTVANATLQTGVVTNTQNPNPADVSNVSGASTETTTENLFG